MGLLLLMLLLWRRWLQVLEAGRKTVLRDWILDSLMWHVRRERRLCQPVIWERFLKFLVHKLPIGSIADGRL